MTKLTGIIMSENKLTGSLGARNEINVDIIGTGARGKEGKSAYEIWLDLGNEGTEQEFLASLKGQDGKDGEPGAKGDKGDDGEKGDKGDDGHTPIKGTDYWTTADQASIVADVLAALPVYDGSVAEV